MLIVAKGNPLSQALIDRDAQECVSLNQQPSHSMPQVPIYAPG